MCHWLTYNSFNLLKVQRLSFDVSETKSEVRKIFLDVFLNLLTT